MILVAVDPVDKSISEIYDDVEMNENPNVEPDVEMWETTETERIETENGLTYAILLPDKIKEGKNQIANNQVVNHLKPKGMQNIIGNFIDLK